MNESMPILELDSVCTSINHIEILHHVSLSMHKGEIHALLGENGAGKSSLAKVLCGIYPLESGSILFEGNPVSIASPEAARNLGIISIQQECNIFEDLTVAENIFVNNLPSPQPGKKSSFYSRKELFRRASEILKSLSFHLDPYEKLKYMPLESKRMVEIARISISNPKILILDEPSSSINLNELESFHTMLRYFTNQGVSVLLITHDFHEWHKLADRIAILRDGQIVATEQNPALSQSEVTKKIWGKYYPDKYPKLNLPRGAEIFCVENMSTASPLKQISFSLHEGEIVGITGLVGSGRSQIAKSILGIHPITEGKFYIDRLEAQIKCPKDAIDHGLAYITEDRHEDGLFLNLNILDNIFVMDNISDSASIKTQTKHKLKLFQTYEKRVNLTTDGHSKALYTLSGGNQQKILLLRWLLSNARIFIFDEPTRGVDIASKVDIYNLLSDLARKKAGLLMISSNFEELVGMCDRILVLRNGSIAYEAKRDVPGDYDSIPEHAFSSEIKSV